MFHHATLLFPGNKKRKLAIPNEHFDALHVGDIVDVKHKGTWVYSAINIEVSTMRAKVIKKHNLKSVSLGYGKNMLVSFLFPDKSTGDLIMPDKLAASIKEGNVVTLTCRGGWVESLKRERAKQ